MFSDNLLTRVICDHFATLERKLVFLYRCIFMILSFVVLQVSEDQPSGTHSADSGASLLGITYTNDNIGGCASGYVRFSSTETTIKVNGDEKTLPVHGLTIVKSPNPALDIVYFQIDMSTSQSPLWWTMVFSRVPLSNSDIIQVDWHVQQHEKLLSTLEVASDITEKPGKYFGRLVVCEQSDLLL